MDTSKKATQLAPVNADVLRSSSNRILSVSSLCTELLAQFPAEDAESWDRTGLIAGNPQDTVRGVAIALDPTVEAVHAAAQCGANVLLTHHPAFIDPPSVFCPINTSSDVAGSVIYAAIESGVALVNFHTALDVSHPASQALPSMLSLEFETIVDRTSASEEKGYGQLCHIRPSDSPITLAQLAARCVSVFGRTPRVWGPEDATISTVVTCTGSCADLPEICSERGYDCLICGEVRYHPALAATARDLAIIEIGHDCSELPLCAVLAAAVEKLGFPEESIKIIDQGKNWWTPEAIRR